ncbi:MAG: hypothetical protein ABI354_01140 [Candidatus Saccharimonadales bacterium]
MTYFDNHETLKSPAGTVERRLGVLGAASDTIDEIMKRMDPALFEPAVIVETPKLPEASQVEPVYVNPEAQSEPEIDTVLAPIISMTPMLAEAKARLEAIFDQEVAA